MSKESEVTEYEQKRMQSKKVLGFYEEDSWQVIAVNNDKIFAVNSNNLVPVRLASESVDLEALQKWCKIIPSKDLTQYEIGYKQALKDTLSWAEKEAKKNE